MVKNFVGWDYIVVFGRRNYHSFSDWLAVEKAHLILTFTLRWTIKCPIQQTETFIVGVRLFVSGLLVMNVPFVLCRKNRLVNLILGA